MYACINFTNINALESGAICSLQYLKCTMISGSDMKGSSRISSIILTYFAIQWDFTRETIVMNQ